LHESKVGNHIDNRPSVFGIQALFFQGLCYGQLGVAKVGYAVGKFPVDFFSGRFSVGGCGQGMN
jgi:hypothetical protein